MRVFPKGSLLRPAWFLVIASLIGLLASCSSFLSRRSPPGDEKSQRVEIDVPSTSAGLAPPLAHAPRGPFSLSMVSTADGKKTSIGSFEPVSTCAECHPRQWDEMNGAMHSVTHYDSLYRRTAELARKEAGEEVYALCSGCHAPQAVASGLVPGTPEDQLPAIAKAGLVCDTCHQISAMKGHDGPWREPANASFEFSPDSDRKFGPLTGEDSAADHAVVSKAYFQSSEFCANCHTVIHPLNGLRLEHTYEEWRTSVYASANIQCQDCHMRTVEEASLVSQTMKPVPAMGTSTPEGAQRLIGRHLFVGANANAQALGGGATHGAMAQERLKGAATLELKNATFAPSTGLLQLDVVVTNVGAGHNLPTSLTELREIWVDLSVTTAEGRLLFHSGALDPKGDIDSHAMRFGAKGGDAAGRHTYKPWEVSQFLWKRLIPPKAAARDRFSIPVPTDVRGPLKVTAQLNYRSAPPSLMEQLFPEGGPEMKTTEMGRVVAEIAAGP